MAEVGRLQKLFCTDTDLTEQSFSNMERHVYENLIVGIEQIHPELQFGTYEVESEHFRWAHHYFRPGGGIVIGKNCLHEKTAEINYLPQRCI